MKKLQTKQPVIPEGWFPKPSKSAYNFIDWACNYFSWCKFIKSEPVDVK